MSKISALMMGQNKEIAKVLINRKADRKCKICGKPIYYGINGAQFFDTCMECYKPDYHCRPTKVRQNVDWDALDAAEDRCLGDDVD